ncbi:hypothetical protein HPDFL43_04410 [Hoeflea phototrophica DFL-43]|jgi:hypothetical protein|uniref:Uncharacterized protein n=1 Tax=Hoeflea phototrophica (strain DSM 17068 / NCIMB 14078 / DFL-43) TaxID=411684 RepID=A9D3E7_HOEPD|nr:hypothetical protein [Hoeflea phototrophica]EDQ33665.1 hypothetical protein HPDFL43_04410 [Hoeflea phototrophica DFL-43]
MLNVFANAMMVATRITPQVSGPARDKWLSPAVRRQQSRNAIAAALGPTPDRNRV